MSELGRDGFEQLNLLYSEFPFKPGYIQNWTGTLQKANPEDCVRGHMFTVTELFHEDTDIYSIDVARVKIEFDYTSCGYAVMKVWYRHPADTWRP